MRPLAAVGRWHGAGGGRVAPVREALYSYFANHNCVEIEKYTKWDGRNAYFVPKEDMPKFLARTRVDELAALQQRGDGFMVYLSPAP